MQNVKPNKMLDLNIRIYLQLGVSGLKTSFGPLGPRRYLGSNKTTKTLLPIFTNNASFYSELRGESNEFLKCLNKVSPRNLGPKNLLWANSVQET